MQISVMGRTPWGNGDLTDAQTPSLLGQVRAEVDADLRAFQDLLAQGIRDFITYFITSTANTYSTMYYKV